MNIAKAGVRIAIVAMALAGVSLAPVAVAQAPADGSDRYGSPAGDMPYDRLILLGSGMRGVSVSRNETISFVTPEGREFRWRFDTFAQFEVFPLSHIAPAGIAVPAGANVYVNGDIPISGP